MAVASARVDQLDHQRGSHVDGNFAKPDSVLVGGSGGAIAMSGGGSLTVTGSTIDDNFADDGGGGVSLIDVPTARSRRLDLGQHR